MNDYSIIIMVYSHLRKQLLRIISLLKHYIYSIRVNTSSIIYIYIRNEI